MTCVRWTDAATDVLRAMFADGHSAAEIAREIGCTRNAAIGKMHRLGLRRQKPSKPLKEKRKRTRKPVAASPQSGPDPIVATVVPDCAPAPGSPPVIAAEIVRSAAVDPPDEPAAPAEPKSFADLGARECKGFTAETKMASPSDTLFCAAPVASGSVYCPACKVRFFVAFRPDMPSEFGRSRFSHSWKRAA